MERTQVGIVGAGPAGLLLSHLLDRQGIDSVVLEQRDQEYVQQRVRAGVLEHPTVELLHEVGLGARLAIDGLQHDGTGLLFDGQLHRLDFRELCGRTVTVYGQQRVVEDLIEARGKDGGDVRFEVADVDLHDLDSTRPRISFAGGSLSCDVIIGADGFHGISRTHVPGTVYERIYPFAWLGILAESAPASEELIYARHAQGFALHSLRSPTVTRQYLQVGPEESLEDWPDTRIWDELHTRLAHPGFSLTEGPIVDRGITPMRSFLTEPMQHGRLFLAGDAAHIVPPTGAKGLNLAVADVRLLSRALGAFYADGRTDLLDAYTVTALRRVWRVTHFSWWMTTMLHNAGDPFDDRVQRSQLEYVVSSRAQATALAENYTGLPFENSWSYA